MHVCGGACVVAWRGHVVAGGHGCWGVCMVAGGRVVAGGMHGCQGTCMVAGGACVVAGGHAWLQVGVCGCGGCAWLWGAFMAAGGACVVAGGCVGYDEIRRYASYWNAFCFDLFSQGRGACPPPRSATG